MTSNGTSLTTAWTYDSNGNKLSEDGPMAGTADTRYWRYNAMRRVTGTIAPDPDGAGGLPLPAARNTYDAAGRLTLEARVPTQGQGTGGGLGNQGAVTLSGNGRHLFVVNARSNTVSTFAVRRSGLRLESSVDSGGLQPISVTEHDGIVFVLNAGGAGNVAGFRHSGGTLRPIADSARPLSAAGGTGPAQVGFNPEGDVLLVTEKATNRLTTYPVRDDGAIGAPVVTASHGVTPFGFAFDPRGRALVSEAFGGAANASAVSSYWLADDGLEVLSASVPTTESAA